MCSYLLRDVEAFLLKKVHGAQAPGKKGDQSWALNLIVPAR